MKEIGYMPFYDILEEIIDDFVDEMIVYPAISENKYSK